MNVDVEILRARILLIYYELGECIFKFADYISERFTMAGRIEEAQSEPIRWVGIAPLTYLTARAPGLSRSLPISYCPQRLDALASSIEKLDIEVAQDAVAVPRLYATTVRCAKLKLSQHWNKYRRTRRQSTSIVRGRGLLQ
jgi:hypothetical protein